MTEEEKAEIAEYEKSLKKQAKQAQKLEAQLETQNGFSRQIYSTDPQTLMRKKSMASASTLIKKVKATMLQVFKLRAELEKILADG